MIKKGRVSKERGAGKVRRITKEGSKGGNNRKGQEEEEGTRKS